MRRYVSRRVVRGAMAIVSAAALATAAGCGSSDDSSGGGGGGGGGGSKKADPAKYMSPSAKLPAAIGNPFTPEAKKELCKNGNLKIGYDTYSETQEFAVAVNGNIKKLADYLGCIKIVQLADNGDGTSAIANVQTMINQGINGLMNFQNVADAQIKIAQLVKNAGIPAEASGGPAQDNAPYVNIDHYKAGFDSGDELVRAAKEKYPDQKAPYFIVGIDRPGGPEQIKQGTGAIAAAKKGFPDLPSSNIIQIEEDGSGPPAYQNTLSALSKVPEDALVLMTSTDSDTNNAQYQAAKVRKRSKFLVEDAAGASLALKNICKFPEYVGTVSYAPETWGNYMLPSVIMMANGTTVPSKINIPTKKITKANDPLCS
jgi:ribose transport system substrate-binding protein